MRHRCSPDALTLLAIGELSTRRATRLQQHLTICSACQAEWESIEQTITLARSVQERKVSNTMQARILSELSLSNTNRRAIPARLLTPRRLALTAGFVFVLLAVLVGLPTRRDGVAFAQVVEAMQTVRTIHYRQLRFWTNSQGQREDVQEEDCWVNWQPMLYSGHDGRRSIIANEQQSIVSVRGEKPWVRPHTSDQPSLREEVMTYVTAPPQGRRAAWQIERVTLEGRSVLRFQQTGNSAETHDRYTIWAEPDTLRVVRSEHSQYNIARDKTYWEVYEQFRYNDPLPEGTFAPLSEQAGTPQPE